jgi:trk system potassium uptake protein
MKLIVVGCGRLGAALAYRLFGKGHQVTVIDQVPAAFDNLPADFRGRTLEGQALDEDVLTRAGIAQADGLAAVTNSDSLNAVVGRVATIRYGLHNVVVRNYDPHWEPMHETFCAQVVSSASWGAQRIEDLLDQPDVRPVLSAGNGEVKVYELQIPAGWQARTLADLLSDSNCLPVALSRAGRATLPEPQASLEPGDVLHVSATADSIKTLRQRLALPEEA